jgi:uncharacterized protein YjbI with pentapeptide repeats
MPLSSELVSQFAKLASNKPKEEKESTVYGTTVIQNGNKYVRLDGSELLTPASFTTNIADGERVTVLIKNHMAVVTGNITSPAARTSEVEEVGNEVKALNAAKANIEDLEATNASIANLNATKANVTDLEATNASIANLNATKANVTDLTAVNASIEKLNADKANVTDLTAVNASIEKLNADKANIEDLKTTYANIDFANVGVADIKKFYAKAGVIQDIDIQNQKITGRLVGVRITGDLIEGETVKANNLIILGDDGLYYKLNVNALGETTASKDDKYKYGLDGSVIVAESITASKISVSDLVAFGATIGGFHISDSSIYSGVKNSVDSPANGIYLDSEGQLVVGDGTNYLKLYKDENNAYILDISSVASLQKDIGDIHNDIDNVHSEISDQRTNISNDSKQIVASALEEYTKIEDFTKYTKSTESKLTIMSDQIDMNFTTVNNSINDANGNTNDRFNKLEKYIRFDENGITIGESGNKLKLVLDNDNITFTKNDQPIGWWDGENFHTGNIVVEVNERAQFGNFAYVPRSDGSIMFLKVSGKES